MTERRPLIGVTTQSLQAVEGIPAAFPASWVMNRMYLDALARAGAAPVLLPLLPEQPQVDGVLPGRSECDVAGH